MTSATFFITTARAGTQWICNGLREHYSDLLVAEHEPVGYAYMPKRYLRNEALLDELRMDPVISRHFERIHQTLGAKSYVEVGFPAYALAPLLVREFQDQLRLVHLIRHPVYVAASVASHHWYESTRKDRLPVAVQPDPWDHGVIQKHYSSRWPHLSTFEKALFYWTEVHLFALEVQVLYRDVPFQVLKFERMLGVPAELECLASFLGVPFRPEWEKTTSTPIDRYRQKTTAAINWREVFRHAQTVALAERFGYDLDSVDGRGVRTRYHRNVWTSALLRAVRGRLRASQQ